MKLGELRAAIRKHKGVVLARAELGGIVVDIPVQKTSFLAMLDAYGENKASESGLTFTDEGIVTPKELIDAELDAGAERADDLMSDGLDLAPEPVESVDDLLGDIEVDLDMDLLG